MGSSLVECPSCSRVRLDIRDYESLIVVAPNMALFTVRCSGCGQRISGLHTIPAEMRDEVQFAAIEVGAGMGRAN